MTSARCSGLLTMQVEQKQIDGSHLTGLLAISLEAAIQPGLAIWLLSMPSPNWPVAVEYSRDLGGHTSTAQFAA